MGRVDLARVPQRRLVAVVPVGDEERRARDALGDRDERVTFASVCSTPSGVASSVSTSASAIAASSARAGSR
jgi:hypothetical protein